MEYICTFFHGDNQNPKCLTQRYDNNVLVQSSYPEHFGGIINIVHVSVVVVQFWTKLIKALAKEAILQIHKQRSKRQRLDVIKKNKSIPLENDHLWHIFKAKVQFQILKCYICQRISKYMVKINLIRCQQQRFGEQEANRKARYGQQKK